MLFRLGSEDQAGSVYQEADWCLVKSVTTLFKSTVAGHIMQKEVQFTAIGMMLLEDLSISYCLVKMLNSGVVKGVSSDK